MPDPARPMAASAQRPEPGTPQPEPPAGQRIRELLDRLHGRHDPDAAWELGTCIDALTETLKEGTVQMQALETENGQLRQRLQRERREYVELRASMDELLDLNELSDTISSSFDPQDIMGALMKLSGRVLAYDSCGVFLWHGDHDDLRPVAMQGGEGLKELVFSLLEDGIIDWVVREGHPVVIEDMGTVAQPGVAEYSFVIIPLRVRGRDLGLYVLHSVRAKDEFTAGQIDLLGVLANQTAIAIDNARLYNDLDDTHQRLKESQSQTILSSKLAAVGELAGGVAHEVNNPLQIILSRVQLMMLQNRADLQLLEGLRLIETNVKRISRIISALLGFAGHNLREQDWGAVDIAEALQQAYALIKHQLDKQRIVASIRCDPDLPLLYGNMGELEQVFINLLINAQNAMPGGGKLEIGAHVDAQGMIEIRCADDGVGIAPEHLERIFEPFFTTRGDAGGTGLGLSVSYGIIEMHRGTITVESEPGRGATFIIRLPVEQAMERPPNDAQ